MVSLKVTTKYQDKTIITDYAPCVSKIDVVTQRIDAAGKMTFVLTENQGISIREGAGVLCEVDGVGLFKGYVFKAEKTVGKKVTYTCYDQLRYLKAKASYAFTAMSVEQIIKRIADDFGLQVGTLESTGYKIPSLIKDNESCLDIIFGALQETNIQTGKIFVFYDDLGKLTLKECKNLQWNKIVGDESLLSNFTYSRSLENTYNRIKFARPNKNTGRADTYFTQNSSTQNQWGVLQLYKVVDENMNEAQIDELCKAYLKYYDRVWQTLKVSKVIAYTPFRAGWFVPIQINDIYNGAIRLFLAEKVTHHLTGDTHVMDIEVKNFDEV